MTKRLKDLTTKRLKDWVSGRWGEMSREGNDEEQVAKMTKIYTKCVKLIDS
jgi:hypothetical protein